MVEETFEPGMTVSLVARRHGVAPNQLFTWRRLVAQGCLTAAGSDEKGKDSIQPKEEEAIWTKLRSAAAVVTNGTRWSISASETAANRTD
jgi:transposase-like protein